jgi:hypothetical protein
MTSFHSTGKYWKNRLKALDSKIPKGPTTAFYVERRGRSEVQAGNPRM